METNKLILACLITLCSLPVAAQVKLGIEAGANLFQLYHRQSFKPFGQQKHESRFSSRPDSRL